LAVTAPVCATSNPARGRQETSILVHSPRRRFGR
jgi:hypothetical protein